MVKFSEETLFNWTKPPSDAEEQKIQNSITMVRAAIDECGEFKEFNINVFAQGSYPNNTNVKLNSDIDINVQITNIFYYKLPNNTKPQDFGLENPSNYTFSDFKNAIQLALMSKFGSSEIERKNKCIQIKGNSYRIVTDVTPTFEHRRYMANGKFHIGSQFKADTGEFIVNWPKQHIENGITKNNNTQKRFKRITRILKRIRYRFDDENIAVSPNITSFLIESLLWNVPDYIYNDNSSLSEQIRNLLVYIYANTDSTEKCKEWGEVSELLYLFHPSRKWSPADVNHFILQLWNYMGFP